MEKYKSQPEGNEIPRQDDMSRDVMGSNPCAGEGFLKRTCTNILQRNVHVKHARDECYVNCLACTCDRRVLISFKALKNAPNIGHSVAKLSVVVVVVVVWNVDDVANLQERERFFFEEGKPVKEDDAALVLLPEL